MPVSSSLRNLEPLNRPSVADTVFDELHSQILLLELPPGTKMSEVEVAKALGRGFRDGMRYRQEADGKGPELDLFRPSGNRAHRLQGPDQRGSRGAR